MSHSSKQKLFVKELRRYLPDILNLWIDEKEILVGQDIESKLKNAIDNECDYLMLILDSYSAQSKWVKKEIEWALEKEKSTKQTYLLCIVTEKEALTNFHTPSILSRKFLKCYTQEDIKIEALAKEISSELLGLLCDKLEDKNNAVQVDDILVKAKELSENVERMIKKALIPHRIGNPLSLINFKTILLNSLGSIKLNIDNTYNFLIKLKSTGYLKGIYFDDEIIYLDKESYNFKHELNKGIKKKIARRAFDEIKNGMLVGIDGGSTTFEIAKLIGNGLLQNSLSDIKIVSNSIAIINYLVEVLSKLEVDEQNPKCALYLVGGKARPTSLTTISWNPSDVEDSQEWNRIISIVGKFDVSFLGTNGVKYPIGFSNKNRFELLAKKNLFENSKKRYILSDPSKFLVEQDEVFAPFNEEQYVITSGEEEYQSAIEEFRNKTKNKKIKLIIA